MADTGFVIAGAGQNINTDDDDWASPGNLTADDSFTTNADVSAPAPRTDTLRAHTFGLSVPTGSTIDGIEVRIDRSTFGFGQCTDGRVQLDRASGGIGEGDNKADTGTNWAALGELKDYGGAADTWALSLTAEEVNADAFSVLLQADRVSQSVQAQVDYIAVRVHYTEGGGAVTGTAAGTLAPATGSATGAEIFAGTGAATLAAATGDATGVLTLTGAGAGTLAAATGEASGTFTAQGVTGTAAATLAAATGSATGAETFAGIAAGALAVAAGEAEGSFFQGVSGSAAAMLQAASGEASGTVEAPAVTGTAAGAFAAATGASAGAVEVVGTVAAVLAAVTGSGIGINDAGIPVADARIIPVQARPDDPAVVARPDSVVAARQSQNVAARTNAIDVASRPHVTVAARLEQSVAARQGEPGIAVRPDVIVAATNRIVEVAARPGAIEVR